MSASLAQLFRDAITSLAIVGSPLFFTLLALGFAIGVFQATTQINDPSLGALPRLAAAAAVCFLLGGWMVQRLSGFLVQALERMAGG